MNAAGSAEFVYRARFASRSQMPGAHRSRTVGAGMDIVGTVPLHRARDPRRLDLRAALRDPFGQWWAHEQRQRSNLRVMLLLDLSASMQAVHGKRVEAFARALQRSALRRGDAFGIAAFSDTLPEALFSPPSRSRQPSDEVLARLRAEAFDGRAASAVIDAAALTPRHAALVFLLSDFLFPVAWLDSALDRMARHDVVPVWLRHAAPGAGERGLLELRDAESGAWRSLWMRPALAQRWREAHDAHERALRECFARHDRVPLTIDAAFDADAVSEFFVARG
jgi:hypothetical protein